MSWQTTGWVMIWINGITGNITDGSFNLNSVKENWLALVVFSLKFIVVFSFWGEIYHQENWWYMRIELPEVSNVFFTSEIGLSCAMNFCTAILHNRICFLDSLQHMYVTKYKRAGQDQGGPQVGHFDQKISLPNCYILCYVIPQVL